MFDLGDPVPLSVEVRDTAGALANAGSVALSVTQPDGTSATITNPVAPASTGVYTYSFTPTQAGRHAVRWVATGINASAFTDAFDVDEAAPTGIVSLQDVRDHLNLTATTNDEELRRFIDAATDFIEGRIGAVVRRTLPPETVTPASDGSLSLSNPIISVTSMAGAYGYPGTYTVGNWNINGSTLYPTYGTTTYCWPITVTYVGGLVIVPPLVRQAALDYIKWLWESQRGSSALPIAGGEFETFTPADVPHKIESSLRRYMTPVVA